MQVHMPARNTNKPTNTLYKQTTTTICSFGSCGNFPNLTRIYLNLRKHIHLLNTVISESIEYRVEYDRSHGKKVAARECNQKLMLVWMGVELQEMEIDGESFEHVLTLNIVEMFIKMFRMLIGAQQMKKIKLTPTRMMLALFLRAIFLIIRILVLGAFVRMFGSALHTLQ